MFLSISVLANYPIGFSFFCLILGIAYALILYYYKNQDINRYIKYLLFGIRTLVVSIIAFFLLSPLIKINNRITEKPVLLFLQDNSESIISNADSLFYKQEYQKNIENLLSDLSDKFNIKTFSFGGTIEDKLKFDFNLKQTDIGEAISQVHQRFTGANIGALVIASDGIYNQGNNPIYVEENSSIPFYAIALGDTIQKQDLLIKQVNYNHRVFIGNYFPLEVLINANKCKGLSSKLEISSENQILFSQQLNINSNNFYLSVPLSIEAKKLGIMKINISLSAVSGEVNIQNNKKTIFVEIDEKKVKILAITNAPHPDISAIKQAIEYNPNFEFKLTSIDNFNENINDFQLIILHQLPSNNGSAIKIINDIEKRELNTLYILGSQSNVNVFNSLKTGLNISNPKPSFIESNAYLQPNFSLFTIDLKFKNILPSLPPLHCIYGNYKSTISYDALFNQRIGNVVTQNPLILFTQINHRKIGIITGEGIWRWKLTIYDQTKDETIFNEFIQKVLQYLITNERKKEFKVFYQNIYNEASNIELSAELYNKSNELISTPDVTIEFSDSEGKKFPFTFARTDNAYYLNAGLFMPGDYSFTAKTALGSNSFVDKGKFVVVKSELEKSNLVANHNLLQNLTKKHQGSVFSTRQLNNLKDTLLQHSEIKSIIRYNQSYFELINLKWLFYLILLLISIEWLIRRQNGKY